MPSTTTTTLERVAKALSRFSRDDCLVASTNLLECLGYESDLTLELSGDVNDFIRELSTDNPGTQTEAAFRDNVTSINIIHQFTDSEIENAVATQGILLDEKLSFDKGNARSFIFVAVELNQNDYSRGKVRRVYPRNQQAFQRAPLLCIFTDTIEPRHFRIR